MFYQQLIELYMNIKIPIQYQNLTSIDGPIMFYQSDQFISSNFKNLSNYVIEIDITSSFPSICQQLYNNTDFINQLNSIKEKKAKNIFISTTLNNTQLKKLNLISKLIICGLVFDHEYINSILIYELKKDSLVLSCNHKAYTYFQNLTNNQVFPFTNFIITNNFKFHITEYLCYIRFGKTSFFYSNNDLILKGMFKYIPPELKTIMTNIFKNNSLIKQDKHQLLKIYNHLYFKIIQHNMLYDLLEKYYLYDKSIINSDFKYCKFNSKTNVNPENYLKLFIFPILRAIL